MVPNIPATPITSVAINPIGSREMDNGNTPAVYSVHQYLNDGTNELLGVWPVLREARCVAVAVALRANATLVEVDGTPTQINPIPVLADVELAELRSMIDEIGFQAHGHQVVDRQLAVNTFTEYLNHRAGRLQKPMTKSLSFEEENELTNRLSTLFNQLVPTHSEQVTETVVAFLKELDLKK